jgi:hypothetical protein
MNQDTNQPTNQPVVKRVHKPKSHALQFAFYLDAWRYAQNEKINKYEIKKTGSREFTLKFVR